MNIATWWVLMSSVTILTSGSGIRINVTPAAFTPLLTKEITLTCAIGGNSTSRSTRDASGLNNLPGHPDRKQQDGGLSTFRAVSTDFTVVTAVVVARNGQDIASVSEHYSAAAFADHAKVKVRGNVSASLGEVTYLTLTWTYPDASQKGNYSCQISGYDRIGHSVAFYGTTVISQEAPTIDDLVAHVYAQEVNMTKLNGEIDVLKTELVDKDGEIGSLKTELRVHEIQSNITISQLTNQYEELGNATNILKVQDEKQALKYQALEDTFAFLNGQGNAQDLNHQALDNLTNSLRIELYNQNIDANLSRSSIVQKLNGFEVKTNLTQATIVQRLDSNDIRASMVQTTQAGLLQQMQHIEDQAIQSQAAFLQQIQALTSRIDAMEVSTPHTSHVETGVVGCGDLGTDQYTTNYPQSRDIIVKFSEVYDQPPHTVMTVAHQDSVVVSFSNVTTQGFTVTCRTLSLVNINGLGINWKATDVSTAHDSLVENGVVGCGELGTRGGYDHNPQSRDATVKFTNVYDRPPNMTMTHINGVVMRISHVTTQGFTATCRLLDPAGYAYGNFNWQAIELK